MAMKLVMQRCFMVAYCSQLMPHCFLIANCAHISLMTCSLQACCMYFVIVSWKHSSEVYVVRN